MENGRDNEGRISAVNRAYSMELNEITNSHRTYSESEINEYAQVDPTTQSWEVSRENVEIQKVIGNGSFGRVAKGIAWNLPAEKGTTTVAVKMLKGTSFSHYLRCFVVFILLESFWLKSTLPRELVSLI